MSHPATRTCGPCTFCCKVMGIRELAKPNGVWCRHIKPGGGGCQIHGQHPAECRAFACHWLNDTTLPHRFRPDQTKVVITSDGTPQHPRLVANCDPANPLAWRREPVYGWLKEQARLTWGQGMVLAKAVNRLWLIAPHEERELGEVEPGRPLRLEFERDGSYRVVISPPMREDAPTPAV